MAAADADEPALLRAAYNLKSDAAMPEQVAAEVVAAQAEATGGSLEGPEPNVANSADTDVPRSDG